MPAGIFEFDPWTGEGTYTDEFGNTIDADVSEYTNNRLYVSNGVLIDRFNPTNPLTLGKQGNATLVELQNERYSLVSQTLRGTVNRVVYGEFLRMVSGTVTASLAGEEPTVLNIDRIPIAGVNAQWIAEAIGPDEWKYSTTRRPFANNLEIQNALGPSFRLASAQEAAYSAIIKQLITMHSDALGEIADREGYVSDTKRSREYKAAALIMKNLDWSNIHSYTSYILE